MSSTINQLLKPNATILLLLFLGCVVNKKNQEQMTQTNHVQNPPLIAANAPVIIYKTKVDYLHRVPVLLSPDKKEILSYPHPTDLSAGGVLLLPTPLNQGFFLDNRGIQSNVAFLNLTYEQYVSLSSPPALNEMYAMIIDKDPLSVMYHCGSRKDFKNIESELNQLIELGLPENRCKRIKK